MSRKATIWALTLLLAIVMLSPTAQAFRFGVGAFAGLNYPAVQDDAKSGSAFGAKARIPLMGFLALEPNFAVLDNGDPEIDVEGGWNEKMTGQGGKITTFGVDLALGSVMGYKGLGVFGLVGISSAKFEKTGIPDISETSYWLGLGIEYGVTDRFSLEVRGKGLILPYEGSLSGDKGSRKNFIVTAGLNIYFGFSEE